MPRVESYPGDRVRTAPSPRARQTAVPTADVFGAVVGEAQGRLAQVQGDAAMRVWGTAGQAASQAGAHVAQIVEEQRKRANDLVQVTAERQFNQLFQVNALGTDRGAQGTRGLLTMEGLEAQEKLSDNLKDWDAQAGEIVAAAKTPEQRLLLEAMRNQQRARYVEQGMRHASAEYAKYETGQVNATLASNVNLAASVIDAPGGAEMAAELLAQNDLLIEQHGHKIGLYSPEQKAEAKTKLRSDAHVLNVQKLMSAGKDIEAEAYFDRVMATTDTHAPEMLESQAAPLRAKVKANSKQVQGMRDGAAIWEEYGPRPGDPSPVRSADMLAAAKKRAGEDIVRYNSAKSDLEEREQALTRQRANVDSAHLETLYGGFWQEVPLSTLKQTPAFQNAAPSTQSKLVSMYESREQNRAQEVRLKRGAIMAEYNFQQFVKEQNGWGKFYDITDPKVLGPIKDMGTLLELIGDDLSVQQMQATVSQWRQTQAGLAGGAGVTLEREIFTQVAMEGLGEWVTLSPGQQTDEQRAALGRLQGLVLTAIATEEAKLAASSGRRTALSPLQQREIAKEIVGRTVMVPGMIWGYTEKRAVMVNADDAGKAYVPWDRISEPERQVMRDFIKKAPIGAGVIQTATMGDTEIDQRYRSAMERAVAAQLRGATTAEWVQILNEAVSAVRHRTHPSYPAR